MQVQGNFLKKLPKTFQKRENRFNQAQKSVPIQKASHSQINTAAKIKAGHSVSSIYNKVSN